MDNAENPKKLPVADEAMRFRPPYGVSGKLCG